MGTNRNLKNFTVQARPDGRRDFYQHDDRGYSSSSNDYNSRNTTGGKQKYSRGGGQYFQNRGNRRGQFNYYRGGSRKNLQNDDIPMAEGLNRHQEMYSRGRGFSKKRGFRGGGSERWRSGFCGWHKITIQGVTSYGAANVISALREYVDNFIPILLETEGINITFYLEKNPEAAKAILKLSGRSFLGDNESIRIGCTEQIPPDRKLTPPQLAILKSVMETRYSIEMKRLDLMNFHNDKTLVNERVFCPLFRRSCFSNVLGIIVASCPHVEEIDLSANEIFNPSDLIMLKGCPNLRRLYMEKNKIRMLAVFEKLEGLQLVELTLEGNPLCDRFKDAESYVNAIRKIFPKVERLDGLNLPKPIGFEVEDNIKLPETKQSFFCSEAAKNVVLQFVQQYYQVYESDNRSALEAAYTEGAMFSISAKIPDNAIGGKYSKWIENANRNMLKVKEADERQKLLYKGRSNIINVLNHLPKLAHDPNSFIIDVPLATPCLMHAIVTGVFKQVTTEKNPPHRNFMKSMVIVPVGSGFCIANDQLFINTATVEQIRKAFKEAVPATSAVSVPQQPAPQQSSNPMAGLDPAKIELINMFAANTKMLPQYCIMCLENNAWDFSKAAQMFLDLQKENKIPPEYFHGAA